MNIECLASELPPASLRPEAPVHLRLADGLAAATQRALRIGSDGRREAIALWAGRPDARGRAYISHLLLPRFISSRFHLTIPQDERVRVVESLRQERLLLFADIHTHPEEAFLSKLDRARPFSARPGFYAIVVPRFASGRPGLGWRFYEARNGGWVEVDARGRVHGWPV